MEALPSSLRFVATTSSSSPFPWLQLTTPVTVSYFLDPVSTPQWGDSPFPCPLLSRDNVIPCLFRGLLPDPLATITNFPPAGISFFPCSRWTKFSYPSLASLRPPQNLFRFTFRFFFSLLGGCFDQTNRPLRHFRKPRPPFPGPADYDDPLPSVVSPPLQHRAFLYVPRHH